MSLLEVTGVAKSYGGIQALNGCSISVEPGQIAGLIGPNGSGKTTLFNVITGYEQVLTGSVAFDGRTITNAGPDRIFAAGIARTFQLTRIFPRISVLENIHVASQRRGLRGLLGRWSSAEEHRRAMEVLDFVGLSKLATEPAGNLSYGQKKLLEFAFIIVTRPRLMLLDEPAGGVNPTLLRHLGDRIRDLNGEGVSFLIVEHDMEFVMGLCDTVMVMHQGCRLAAGKPAEIRSSPAVLEAYLGTDDLVAEEA